MITFLCFALLAVAVGGVCVLCGCWRELYRLRTGDHVLFSWERDQKEKRRRRRVFRL